MSLIDSISSSITTIISWIGEVITSLTAQDGVLAPLLPLFAIGIGVSAILLAIKVIRGFIWGA